MSTSFSRRHFLAACGLTAVYCEAASRFSTVFGAESERPFRVGICDWDLGTTGSLKSFAIAKELGFDGVEVSYQPDGEDSLKTKENRPRFLDAAKQAGVEISSLAMGLLNGRPLATVPEAEEWVSDAIDALFDMKLKNVLLAFFGEGDFKEKPDDRKIVAEKLKRLAPKAEKLKRTLGIESYLDAKEHLELLQAIGSDAVKVYYDEQNMLTKKYEIYDELELLLKEKAVCQIHMKEYGARLGQGKVDFLKIRNLLEKYEYKGWVVVESSVQGDWKESQAENAAYLKKLLQKK